MATPDPLGDVIPELSLVRNPQDGLYYKVSPTELDLFTRSSAPPLPADSEVAMPEEQGTSVLDYGKLFMLGGAQSAQAIGWLTKKAGLESFGQAVEDLGTNAVDYWQNALTPAMQQELAKQFIVKNDMGEYEWGDAGFGTAIATGVTSLPATMLSFGVGGGLTKVLQVFANPAGRSALAAAAKAGSQAAAKKLAFVDSVLGTAGFGAAEGIQGGASVGQQVESQVLKLAPEKLAQSERYQEIFNSTDEDMPWAERHNYAATTLAKEAASEAGWQSGLTTALLGAPMGAFFGRALGRRASDLMAATATRRVGAAAAGEAAQEFLQSGGEQLAQNRALIGAGDTDRGTWDDVLNQAVGGALAGAALGGAFGLAEPAPQQQSSAGTAAGGGAAAGTAAPPSPPGATATAPAAAGPAGTPGTTATPGPRLPKAAQDTLAAAARAAVASGADRAQVLEVVKRAASGQSELLPTLRVLNDMGKAAGEAGPSSSSPSTAAEAPPASPAVALSPEGAAPPSPSTAPTGASAVLPIPGDTVQAAPEPPKQAVVPAASEGQTTPKAASADVPRGTPAEPFPVRADGEDEAAHAARAKAWLKANIDPRPVPDPRSMSKDPAAYFEGGEAVPIARLITEKDANDKGGRIALTRFQAAAQGEIPKRGPVKVRDNGDGTYTVLDGNGTVNAMRTMGLPAVNVEVTETVPKVEKRVVPGARQTAYAGQMPVEAQFQLRELADLVPSHTADGTPDPRYPQERQNRDRSRVASQVWVKETAGSFVPEKMIEGVDIGAGAPVVDSGGIVDSGNGRVLLLNEVYNQGKDGPYRDYLRANAAKFGLTPEQVDSFKQPALVRTRPDTMSAGDVIAMTREANRPQIATLSPAEQARNDSERISDEAMMLYAPDDSGNVLASSNDRFISAFMREIPAAERGELMTSDGKPNKVLADRLRAAMFQRAYGDERLLNAMAEDADPEFKNVLTALTNAAPAFAKARAAGANELIPDLIDGVELVRKAKREGMTVEQLLNQGQMFDPVPAGPARMAKFLAANMRSAKRMATALSELGSALERSARGKQSVDMFGGAPETPQGLLDAVNQDMTRRFVFGGGQAAMFSRDKSPRAELYAVTAEPGRPLLKARVPKQQWRYVWARFIGTQLGLDMDGLFSRGMAAQSELVTTATETEGRVGGHFVNPDMKKRATTEGKLIRKGIQPGRVTDIARGGFVADSPEQADEIVKHIASRYAIVDEGWETTPAGYTDRKVAVRMSNGLIAELQLWSAPMKAAKMEGLDGSMKGQKMYDEWRDLEVRNPQTGELTIKDPVRYYELGAQMNRLYALAIDRSIAQNPAWKKTLADPDALRAIADQLEAKSVAAGGTSGSSAPSMYSRASDSVSSRPEPIVSSAEQGIQPSPRLTRAAMSGNASQTIATPADSTSQNDRLAAAQSTTATPPSSSVPDSPPGGPLFRRADPVDSPAFKAWFGASKVVNEDGTPKVVYHGTAWDFDQPEIKQGFYSSPDERYAEKFAVDTSMAEFATGGDANPTVIPMYLRAENPVDLRSLGEREVTVTDIGNAMRAQGVPADRVDIFEETLSGGNPYEKHKVWNWLRYAPSIFREALEGTKFDAIFQRESNGGPPADAYWTWIPGAYKHAEKNAGSFDGNNPSMLLRRTPGGASGLTTDAVQQSIGKAAAEVAPAVRVRVVQSVADLGDSAIPGDVEGVYWPGGNEVVLVADNLRDAEHAQRVFAHEVFGHLAAELHAAFQEALQAVYRLKGIGSREVVAAWNHVARTQPGLDRTTHAKEVIARIAESGTDAPWFQKLVAAVRSQLRSWGLNLNWSENDLRGFIRDAATDLRMAAYRRRYMDRHDGIARQLAGLASQQKLQDENAAQPLNDLYPHDAIDWILELDAELAALEATGKAPRRPEQATPAPRPEAYADTATYGPGEQPEDAEPPVMQYGQNRFAGVQFSRGGVAMDPALDAIYQRVMQVPPDQLPFRDRMRAFIGRFKKNDALSVKQGLIDSFASIEALEKGRFGAVLDAAQSAYKSALATKNLPSVMAAVMMRGVPEYRDGSFQPVAGRKGFIEIFKPLTTHGDGNLLNHWKLWAAANRAQRLIKEGREKLFTQADIDEALKLEQKYPFFRDVLADWQAFNKQLLDLAEDRGVVDPEGRALWAANDYVPFYRVMEDAEGAQGPGTGGGLSGAKASIKRLSGSDLQLGDVLENMVLNTTHLIDRSFRNTAMQRIVGLADGVAMEKVPMPALPKKYGLEQVRSALAKVGIDVGDLSPEQLDQYVTLWNRVAPKGPDIVSVYEKGRAEYYRVSDPLLLRSVAGMGFDNFSDVLGVFRGSKKLLTSAITADPSFMVANFVRDTLSNWVTSSASPHPFVGAFAGFKASLKEDENLMKLMMAGGGGGGYYDSNPEDVRKLLADKVPSGQMNAFMKTIVTPKSAWKVWRKIGAATENANRLGVFKAVIERGGSVAEAAYEARDVLNFSMRGDYAAMRWLIETVPFMNARVQGLYRLYRGARENPRTFALKGMAVMAATMALLLRNNDREEYEELREWDKDTYWHLFVGGEHYRIPKPFEVGIIFATMPERLMRWGSGRDSHQILMKQIQSAVMDTLAFNPTPQLIKPLIEQYANRSMFTGSPIVGMAEKQLKPEAQFDAWTSETARELAKALPDFAPEWLRSPVRLQAAVRAYTGTLGMYVLNASDYVTRSMGGYPEAPAGSKYDLPVFGRFVRDPNPRSTKYSDQLYAMLEEANTLHSTINRYRREGQLQTAADLLEENRGKLAVRGRLNAIALQVRNVNNQIRLTQLSRSLSADEKKARIDALLERKNELTARVAPLSAAF